MRTDGIFDYRVVEVEFEKYNQPISYYPLSDIHFDSPNFAHDTWDDFWYQVDRDENKKIFTLGGDTFDKFSTTERRIIRDNIHDTSYQSISQQHVKDIDNFTDFVETRMKGNTIGVFGGNHYFHFLDGTHTENVVANKLNAPYIGTCGFIILILKYKYDKSQNHAVKIFLHHGVSDAKMKKTPMHFRADLIVMGHTHQTWAIPQADIGVECRGGKWKVVHHETRMVRTGSFLKSYEAGISSYPVDSLMSPAMLGCPKILITPRISDKQVNGNVTRTRWVDIKAVV